MMKKSNAPIYFLFVQMLYRLQHIVFYTSSKSNCMVIVLQSVLLPKTHLAHLYLSIQVMSGEWHCVMKQRNVAKSTTYIQTSHVVYLSNLPTCMNKNHYFIATLLFPDFSRHTS